MLVVDGVPLAVDDGLKVVVFGDQDPVIGEQRPDAAHRIRDVLDVRQDVAGGNDPGLAVLRDDSSRELLGEELPVGGAGDPVGLPRRLNPDRPAVELV
jgi:hypothetical protein